MWNSSDSSIPSPTERAAARARVANKLQGEPLGNDATPHIRKDRDRDRAGDGPVSPPMGVTVTPGGDLRHVRMSITHAHDHASFGFGLGGDGIHFHEHTHYGDKDHDHHH